MIFYETLYQDLTGDILTQIKTNFNEEKKSFLFIEIDGVKFKGTSFDDFRLVNPSSYSSRELERFTFNKGKIEKSGEFIYELCNCTLAFEIPVKIIVSPNKKTINTNLKVILELGKPAANGGIDHENATFKISIDKEEFISEGDVFEIGLEKLQQQFKNKYHFKNCFGCLYSDYSPYGNGFFGDMMCFKKNKQGYLNVKSKQELFQLIDKGIIWAQETYCCTEFKIRKKDIGYRG